MDNPKNSKVIKKSHSFIIMIEVEQKFLLSEDQKTLLLQHAEFLNKRIFTDTYYDTKEYQLTTKNEWLRSREGKFELKIPVNHNTKTITTQYEELETEEEIKNYLHFNSQESLETLLQKQGYTPFCTFTTTREKYKSEAFILDFDTVDFGDFIYHIAEIELMIESKEHVEQATRKIIDFASQYNLKIAPVRGKVIEYICKKRPEHYQALREYNIV